MRPGWVIDSSIGFAWVHPNQATEATTSLLHGENLQRLFIPALWFIEMANGLLVLQKRKKMTADERVVAMETLRTLNLTVDEDAGRSAVGAAVALAEEHDLSVYDAIYLELVLRRKLHLASRDEALIRAAKRCGLKTL